MALPIYTHIPNLKVLTKIFFKLLRPKGNLCSGVTVLNPKYPRLSSGDTMKMAISAFNSGHKNDNIASFSLVSTNAHWPHNLQCPADLSAVGYE